MPKAVTGSWGIETVTDSIKHMEPARTNRRKRDPRICAACTVDVNKRTVDDLVRTVDDRVRTVDDRVRTVDDLVRTLEGRGCTVGAGVG
ncbi:hypothetical protein GORHZ_131_00150 [Gordonia rhizosphera NBRC 16068]|uniref:Uncharacterized protein n=1 Tax=Gordonia rhizosphera NBRC 16068 TaxID=1108045 RepID=K6V5D6_9ACTN|nr:hypothetical protein GORHZ_131_00150 [Gordonia rhizosphera NBRC 16068]